MRSTIPEILPVVAAESADPLLLLGGAALGAWGIFNGVQTWRGREARSITRHGERTGQPDPARAWVLGGRRLYQSFLGAGLSGIPIGLGFLLIVGGVAVRDGLDRPADWAPWYATAIVATVLLGAGFLYSLAYFCTGVPDWLRPPSQRGQSEPDDPRGENRTRARRTWGALRDPPGARR
ncbi:hypothetical protein BH20ACT2_BH20ACT2_08160 [soil metagenome]